MKKFTNKEMLSACVQLEEAIKNFEENIPNDHTVLWLIDEYPLEDYGRLDEILPLLKVLMVKLQNSLRLDE